MLQLVNYCTNNDVDDDDDDDDTKKEKRNIFEGFRCDQYAQFLVNWRELLLHWYTLLADTDVRTAAGRFYVFHHLYLLKCDSF